MAELLRRILDILEKRAGWRHALELTILLVGATSTVYVVSREVTTPQVLAVTFWMVFSLWYVALFYRVRLRSHAWWVRTLAIMSLLIWCLVLLRYKTSEQTELMKLSGLGSDFEHRGLYKEAAAFYTKCASTALTLGNTKAEQDCVCALARAQALTKDSIAKITIESCLSLSAETNTPLSQADALVMLGDFESAEGNYETATLDYKQSETIYRSLANSVGIANIERALGDLEHLRGNFDAAKQRYDNALAIYQTQGICLGEANVLLRIAELESVEGDVGIARMQFSQARDLYMEEGDRLGQANVARSCGRMLARVGNSAEGVQFLLSAAKIYNEGGMPDLAGQAMAEAELLASVKKP